MTRRLTIVTEHCRTSRAPADNMNWEAIAAPWHKDNPIGYGPSEGDAVADLYHQIAEREDEDDEERYRHETRDPDLALEQKRDDELWEKLK